ncbi:hypothetical protein [Spirochaeta cellobiosiphila]|uniref:hypothetical protein n=1 Tax=Spirochaeta cellobiosiphila TaxID=504483 RepID=UPI0012EB6DAD|nr:hypothetical protein [Spirochaeta cellobiosiphila]
MKKIKPITVILLVFISLNLSSCLALKNLNVNRLAELKIDSGFTSGLDYHYEPLDWITEADLSMTGIIFLASIVDVPTGIYEYRFNIYDPDNELVSSIHESVYIDLGPDDYWSFWTKYKFDPQEDLPGDWTFEFYIDNVLIDVKILPVDSVEDESHKYNINLSL